MNIDPFNMFGLGRLRDRTPRPHHHNPERTSAWNRWRENQALHPRGRIVEVKPRAQRQERRPDYDAKVSTRASRRRRDRARSLAER